MTQKEHDEKVNELKVQLAEAEQKIKDVRNELDELSKVQIEPELRRWKHEYGEDYCYISPSGKVCHDKWTEHTVDFNRYAIGNVFKTEEDAEFAVERLKVIAKLSEFAEPEDRVWNSFNYHYSISYNYNKGGLDINAWSVMRSDSIYFESKDKAREAIEAVGEDRIKKYYLRVKKGE